MKKIAYLILAHSDPTQLGMLCKALDKEYCDLYIHIDAKQSDMEIFKKAAAGTNACFLKERISVSWSGISMIDAQNLLIKRALVYKQKYSHIVFLSGSCYPIKNTSLIYERLTQNPRSQYIKYIDMRESPEHYIKQITQKWFKEPIIGDTKSWLLLFLSKVTRRLLNKLKIQNYWNEKMIPYCGSTWCALTTDCCQYIIDFQDENPWYRQMNKYTFCPDEHFYHTIVGNSQFSTDPLPFESRGTWRFANFHIIDPSLSKWFTVDDWDAVVSSDKFFVRKVRSFDSKALVDRINRELLV